MPVPFARPILCTVLLALASAVPAQKKSAAKPAPNAAEQRTAAAFKAAKQAGPPELYAFLVGMPKGADLHMHLSGAVYAETFLAEAVQQGLCVDPVALKFTPPMVSDGASACGAGNVPASTVLKDQHLYDQLVDAFSMRAFVPSEGFTGHDQFFATFARFGGLNGDIGAWLDEVATRAAAQNEQYLEIMITPPFSHAAGLGYKIGWPSDANQSVSTEELAALRSALLNSGIKQEMPADLQQAADALAERRKIEHCGALSDAAGPKESPACAVQIHFLFQVLRAFPPEQVFAQTLLGFEVASANADFVGINFVQPEDDRRAMADYHLQMQMLDYLHTVYPNVNISLHAGELAPGLVPYEGMSFHIHEAVDLGHASRIGHGVDVLYETDAAALLKEMAEKHVMVEINLSSNDGILGIRGNEHPLHAYMAAHVPVALSTDDEGVSRIDLTHEYVRGAEDQGLTYFELKQMARTSLEHAFFQGDSLWAVPDDFSKRTAVCAGPVIPIGLPDGPCGAFLQDNERARQQYQLEQRFTVFDGLH